MIIKKNFMDRLHPFYAATNHIVHMRVNLVKRDGQISQIVSQILR